MLTNKFEKHNTVLIPAEKVNFSSERPVSFKSYPRYNSRQWRRTHAPYKRCNGPYGGKIEDVLAFRGRLENFPEPSFGSYDVLNIDPNLCFERETRLGPYGFGERIKAANRTLYWDYVDWAELQDQCLEKNKMRFESIHPPNRFVKPEHENSTGEQDTENPQTGEEEKTDLPILGSAKTNATPSRMPNRGNITRDDTGPSQESQKPREPRTAILLRSYTGKKYLENDKQVIRSMIAELSLRTGGEFQVFLLVQVKTGVDLWSSEQSYKAVLESEVPPEFRRITVLWDDESVQRAYPELEQEATKVHNGQFLSVQLFMQKYRQFDFVWNWELDARLIGHHYDFLTKVAEFGKKQPRKGLWERNERFYMPAVHGDYDTEYRESVELASGNDTVWGAPELPVVDPIGPKPPVPLARDDDYEWGVDEEADLVTLSPIFNPNNSNWILRDQVWGYNAQGFQGKKDLPRRCTIITHSRLSRRLADIMHAESLRGNQVASEMVPQTVSLIHGLKAVYAPMPVFFDRPWKPNQLERWFNGGPGGVSGGEGSTMGWGREGRFQGSTWYYRAVPPQRMYNNWMGYEDTGIGGSVWEQIHGRPCLPAMFLHPIKAIEPTGQGYSSDSKLPYQ